MAVQERQKRGGQYKCFSSRLTPDLYKRLNDWAWEQRLSLANASAILIQKAMEAEKGVPYQPERRVHNPSC